MVIWHAASAFASLGFKLWCSLSLWWNSHKSHDYQPECNCDRKYCQKCGLPAKVLDYRCTSYEANDCASGKCRSKYCLCQCKFFLRNNFSNDAKGDRKHGHTHTLRRPCSNHEFDTGRKSSSQNAYCIDCHYYEQYLFLAIDIRELAADGRHYGCRDYVGGQQP